MNWWHRTPDMWHVTCEMWHMVGANILSKFQLPRFYSLGLPVSLRFWTKGWANQWINYEGAYRTAPATLGLVIVSDSGWSTCFPLMDLPSLSKGRHPKKNVFLLDIVQRVGGGVQPESKSFNVVLLPYSRLAILPSLLIGKSGRPYIRLVVWLVGCPSRSRQFWCYSGLWRCSS